MTREEFSRALADLGLSRSAALTARLLGITTRHVYYLAAGRSPVPGSVARVLALLAWAQTLGVSPEAVLGVLPEEVLGGSPDGTPRGAEGAPTPSRT